MISDSRVTGKNNTAARGGNDEDQVLFHVIVNIVLISPLSLQLPLAGGNNPQSVVGAGRTSL